MRLNKVSELIHNSSNHQNLDSAGVSVHFQEIIDMVLFEAWVEFSTFLICSANNHFTFSVPVSRMMGTTVLLRVVTLSSQGLLSVTTLLNTT